MSRRRSRSCFIHRLLDAYRGEQVDEHRRVHVRPWLEQVADEPETSLPHRFGRLVEQADVGAAHFSEDPGRTRPQRRGGHLELVANGVLEERQPGAVDKRWS